MKYPHYPVNPGFYIVFRQIIRIREESMGHPQFISLYHQEMNIDFLLRFFHQQRLNSELFQYSHMVIKVCHLPKGRRF